MKLFDTFKKIRGIKSEIKTLARAYMDARTPLGTKIAIAAAGLAYIVIPFDILPEFLLLLGITDDMLILPLLMWTFIPDNIMGDARAYVTKNETPGKTRHRWIFWTVVGLAALGLGIIIYLLVN